MKTVNKYSKGLLPQEPGIVPLETSQKLVNFKDLSKLFGRSENSLRYHFKKGRFTASAKFGRSYSFAPNEVLKQLQRGIKNPR